MKNIISWIAQIIAAVIMFQTLFFKFSAAPESVEIFTRLGVEPWGRIGVGVLELIASLLLLVPRTAWAGALLGVGLMAGAIFSHLTQLGIVIQNDGGQLFIYAVLVLICSLTVLYLHRAKIPLVSKLIA
ncbi:MAG: DoxX family protein [Microscillaceae bacterium]|nr:DoxX family protein [Microscillaceae bacterium]